MRIFISILLVSVSFLSFSQKKFSTLISLGVGSVFETKFPNCEKRERNRFAFSLTQYMSLGNKYAIGIEAISSGDIWTANRVDCDRHDVTTNTTTPNHNNLKASNFFVRTQYTFDTQKKFKPFVSLGIGAINYFYGSISEDQKRIRKISLGVSPELGVKVSSFEISLKLILGGETPEFNGFNTFSGNNISLSSIKSQQLYFNVAYPIFKF